MENFEYFAAKDVKEACSLLSRYGEEAKILSGGQSLVSMMKQGLIMPLYIIDIKLFNLFLYIVPRLENVCYNLFMLNKRCANTNKNRLFERLYNL